MKNDYRNTIYCKKLEKIAEKKIKLREEIHKEHSQLKITYKKVKDKDDKYKKKFMEIYNFKCSYCGNSIANINADFFEIDHFICESSYKNNKEEAGRIENLVLSCYDCNRGKSNLLIEENYINSLNPDLDGITNVFYRDDMYYIKIAGDYKNDEFIKIFYEQLKLGYQTRRLDFLLMNIRGMFSKVEGTPLGDKLNDIIIKLQSKRNLTTCKQL